MMRITNGMMVNTLKRNMSSNMLQMSDLQLQLSTGKKLNKPSDDPAGVVKSLRLRSSLVESAQYRNNDQEAASFMQTADDALGSIDEICQKINELTVKAATGTNNQDSEDAIAKEILQLNEQLKLVSNTVYGTKYIFGGTNVTETPYQNGNWLGNENIMEYEIGVGVKIPVNLNMKGYFMGRLDSLYINGNTGIKGITANNMQEGQYAIKAGYGSSTNSSAAESQSYLSSISKNKSFFYQDTMTSASLGAGKNPYVPGNDCTYNSSLQLEVKRVTAGVPAGTPRADMIGNYKLTFNSALYQGGSAVANGDLAAGFTYTPTGAGTLNTANYDAATKTVTFDVTGANTGDTIVWNNNYLGPGANLLYDAAGNAYTPITCTFDGTTNSWVYDTASTPPGDKFTAKTTGSNILQFDRVVVPKSSTLPAIPNGTNLTTSFNYSGTGSLTSAIYNSANNSVSFNTTGAVAGDTLIWNNDIGGIGQNQLVDATGKAYSPLKATFDGISWVYDDNAKVTVDIKGHVYNAQGDYKYVEQKDVVINMETGAAGALFTIPASAFNTDNGTAAGVPDLNFMDSLVIWNNGTGALGGIDPTNPQIKVGDKTVISTTAVGSATSQKVELRSVFLDKNGNKMDARSQTYAFNSLFFDYTTRELKYFTLGETTGLSYSGSVSITVNEFVNTPIDPNNPPTSFDYKAGLFQYVNDLARKIEVGKLPQVGNELEGGGERMKELLLYRSTLGARINRLELQISRLTHTEETMTALLATNEDANIAEVIMNLKMQENVYNSSLSAGARIIQPTLMDFLR